MGLYVLGIALQMAVSYGLTDVYAYVWMCVGIPFVLEVLLALWVKCVEVDAKRKRRVGEAVKERRRQIESVRPPERES
jgi:heme exporter protein D